MQQREAQEVSLHKVFSSDLDFRIPDYQRPYAWETEQATQLLADLEESLERGPEEPYFLGSVVLVKVKSHAHADVIDGQQRLTTLTILLALLALLRDLTEDAELRSDLDKPINVLSHCWLTSGTWSRWSSGVGDMVRPALAMPDTHHCRAGRVSCVSSTRAALQRA